MERMKRADVEWSEYFAGFFFVRRIPFWAEFGVVGQVFDTRGHLGVGYPSDPGLVKVE
jgi:hypothetical protein